MFLHAPRRATRTCRLALALGTEAPHIDQILVLQVPENPQLAESSLRDLDKRDWTTNHG